MLDALIIIFDLEAESAGIAAERHVLVSLGDEVEIAGSACFGGFFCICGGGLEEFYPRSRKGAEAYQSRGAEDHRGAADRFHEETDSFRGVGCGASESEAPACLRAPRSGWMAHTTKKMAVRVSTMVAPAGRSMAHAR